MSVDQIDTSAAGIYRRIRSGCLLRQGGTAASQSAIAALATANYRPLPLPPAGCMMHGQCLCASLLAPADERHQLGGAGAFRDNALRLGFNIGVAWQAARQREGHEKARDHAGDLHGLDGVQSSKGIVSHSSRLRSVWATIKRIVRFAAKGDAQ